MAGAVAALVPIAGLNFEAVASASTSELPTMLPVSPEDTAEMVAQGVSESDLGSSRLVGQVEESEPFTMIGVKLRKTPLGSILIRTRSVHSDWSGWKVLEVEAEEGPDSSSDEFTRSVSSEPVWVGPASAYEVSMLASDVDDAQVVVVREELERSVVDATPLADAEILNGVNLNERSAWSARAPKSSPNVAAKVTLAVVHHSDSGNNYSQSQVPSILRGIQAYHMDSRGWDDIGYNFIVDKYGTLWEGRSGGADLPVVGAHASGLNTGSVGVMVLGDYTAATPSNAAVESVSRVIGWKFAISGVDTSTRVDFTPGSGSPRFAPGVAVNLPRVVGHGDVGYTSCPGSVSGRLADIRTRSLDWSRWFAPLLVPPGKIISTTGGSGSVSITGFANNSSGTGAATVRVTSDGKTLNLTANQATSAVGAKPNTGFSGSLSGIRPGFQRVCAVITSGSASGTDLGCWGVIVADPTGKSPVGGLAGFSGGMGSVYIGGWAFDPETSDPVLVDITVDGVLKRTVYADEQTPYMSPADAGRLGTAHGFSATSVGVLAGNRDVCAKIRNLHAGQDVTLTCVTVTAVGALPEGSFETAKTGTGTITVTGWALDRETQSSTNVLITVDDVWHVVLADKYRSDIATAYPGYGPYHGVSETISAAKGGRKVCFFPLNVGDGTNVQSGCTNVVVK